MVGFLVAERFVSINGEGRRAGELAVFLRFCRCNLQCSFCDTRWANGADAPGEEMSTEQLVEYVRSTGVRNVTLTGGEPLLQEKIGALILALDALGGEIEIETNGSVPLKPLLPFPVRSSITMDYKLPGSGMERFMCLENFACLREQDSVKFVVGDRADLRRAAEIIRIYALAERCRVYFSPVFGAIPPSEIVDFMKEQRLDRVRLQLQLHKYIWDPAQRGV